MSTDETTDAVRDDNDGWIDADALKKDLEELLSISKSSNATAADLDDDDDDDEVTTTNNNATTAAADISTMTEPTLSNNDDFPPLPPPPPPPLPPPVEVSTMLMQEQQQQHHKVVDGVVKKKNSTGNTTKKKLKKVKDFVVPSHLIPNVETDSELELKKKRRAIKVLKNKYRHTKKDIESTNRQKTWQSFQQKTSKTKDSNSIFSTAGDGIHDRVGVASKKHKTEFGTRKRHK